MAEESPYQGVEFTSDEERAYFEEARLGIEIENFIVRSEIGRYLHGRAKLDYEQAKEDLLACDPHDGASAAECRHRAGVANSLMRYISEGIANGRNSEQQLKILQEES